MDFNSVIFKSNGEKWPLSFVMDCAESAYIQSKFLLCGKGLNEYKRLFLYRYGGLID